MSDRIASALLGRGMLPRDLPPVFASASLGRAYKRLSPQINKSPWTKPERFSLPKAKLGRRTAYLVNPVPYLVLCREIASEWNAIRRHLRKSSISGYTPSFFGKQRALREIDFARLRERKIEESSGHFFVLETDYARFFPTIYTHSIPWALHTKAIAKANQKDFSFLGNRLDRQVTHLQEGQTAGIPIGPDASYILAELISASIDAELRNSMTLFGLRAVDDITLFFRSRADAEAALSSLAQVASEYQIELNPQKTSILSIWEQQSNAWVFSLSAFRFSKGATGQRNSLAKLTGLAVAEFARCGDGAIGRYAVKKISSTVIANANLDFAVSCILKLCAISPSAIPDAAAFVVSYLRHGFSIDLKPVLRFIESTVEMSAPLGHDMEASWALWLALHLNLKLGSRAKAYVEASQSSVLVILGVLLAGKRLWKGAQFSPALSATPPNIDSFKSEKWLLHYEGARRGWFGWGKAELQGSILKELDSADVTFLDPGASIVDILKVRPGKAAVAPSTVRNSSLARLQEIFESHPVHSDYGVVADDELHESAALGEEE